MQHVENGGITVRCDLCKTCASTTRTGKFRVHHYWADDPATGKRARYCCERSGEDASAQIKLKMLQRELWSLAHRATSAQADVDYHAAHIISMYATFATSCERRDEATKLLDEFLAEHPELALPEK